MKLIVGLGNPGKNYQRTRHNFGFLAINYFRANSDSGGFSSWLVDKKANAIISQGKIENEQVVLAKPQAFMNLSGQTVKWLTDFYKINILDDLWLIHDDFDLPLGMIRLSRNASCAGHKGVKSIIEALGTKDFLRWRLGIHPIGKTFLSVIFKKLISVEKFVLKNFAKDEFKLVDETIKKTSQALEIAIKEGVEQAMNQFN